MRSCVLGLLLACELATGAVVQKPWLRFRGGADEDDADAAVLSSLKAKQVTGRMTREEVEEKLNSVPTFCIMQADGSVISLPDPNGEEGDECCTWFLDAAEARLTFRRVVAANPDTEGLRLVAHGLGDTFSMCGGWPSSDESGSGYAGKLRIQGSQALMKPIEAQLVASLKQASIDPGAWQLPVFMGEELAQAGPDGDQRALPVFMDPFDLKDAYEKAGALTKEVAARGPKVLELRMLAGYMADEPKEYPNAWRAVQFIPSTEAAKLAGELAQQQTQS